MFKLLLADKAKKQVKLIKKLHHRKAFLQIFEDIKEDPLIGKPLEDELKGEFSYRVGVYRVLYIIDWQDNKVTVLSARHRKVAYLK